MTAEEFDSLGERLGKMTARAAERHRLTQPRVLAIVERVLTAVHDVPRD
jgi:hypothetical protein